MALVKNPVAHARTQHVDIKYHYNQEAIQDGLIALRYCTTNEMIASLFDKSWSVYDYNWSNDVEWMNVCFVHRSPCNCAVLSLCYGFSSVQTKQGVVTANSPVEPSVTVKSSDQEVNFHWIKWSRYFRKCWLSYTSLAKSENLCQIINQQSSINQSRLLLR